MPIAISGRSVVESNEFERLSKIKMSTPTNLFQSKTRSMSQAISPFLKYEFRFAPSSFTHEGYGVSFNEINRPYSTPVVDVTGGKALRCSFEFVLAEDGFSRPVDIEIQLLQEIANYGIPVDFDNVHEALATPLWYIDNMSFTHTRINSDGQTSAASCNLSLIEFRPRSQKMILLPRFNYGKFKPPGKPGKPPTDNTVPWDDPKGLTDYILGLKSTGNTDAARWTALAAAAKTGK